MTNIPSPLRHSFLGLFNDLIPAHLPVLAHSFHSRLSGSPFPGSVVLPAFFAFCTAASCLRESSSPCAPLGLRAKSFTTRFFQWPYCVLPSSNHYSRSYFVIVKRGRVPVSRPKNLAIMNVRPTPRGRSSIGSSQGRRKQRPTVPRL